MIGRLNETEDALRRACGTVGRADGVVWFRSDEFPRWLMGTGIRPDNPESRSLSEWASAHDEIHAGWHGHHRLLEFVTTEHTRPLAEAARAAGWTVYDGLWMARSTANVPAPTPAAGFRIEEVIDADGWARLRAFDWREFNEDDEAEAHPDRFEAYIASTRACAERTPVRWFEIVADAANGPETVARGGVFASDGMARYQSIGVRSDRRRRGLGTMIVDHLAWVARAELGCDRVGLSAIRGEAGQRMYAALGFDVVGEQTYLLQRPEARG